MSIKICLDAGHYGKYNRSPAVKTYYESDMNWKLHLLLKEELESYGIEVITTRADKDKDLALVDRGKASKGCDLFISIHSNAAGSKTNDDVDYPLAIVQLDGKGNALGEKLADTVKQTMGCKQNANIWTRRGTYGGEYYGVLWGSANVGTMGMILEHSFHTCTKMAKWLSDDANLAKLAKAEAKVIADYFGVKAEDYPLKQFVKDVQKACGAAVDGIPGEETLGKTVTISATFNPTHAAVKPVQKRLAILGYDEVGTADGIAGPKFTSALAHFQKDNGCTPTGLAEEWGKTWQKLLAMA